MDDAAGDLEIGFGQPVERIVGHAVAAHEFRLRVGAEAMALASMAAMTAVATVQRKAPAVFTATRFGSRPVACCR